jgi:hypothetical protein
MSSDASPPSMLPNPQPASEPVYVVRLRIQLRSKIEMESRRRTEPENLRLRTEITRLQSLLRRRAWKLD